MATQPLMNVFNRLSVAFDHGEGAWLYDTEGNKYLDALCGIAVTGLGHAHPAITRAISEQAAKLIHCSNLYTIPQQTELAAKLARISGMETPSSPIPGPKPTRPPSNWPAATATTGGSTTRRSS